MKTLHHVRIPALFAGAFALTAAIAAPAEAGFVAENIAFQVSGGLNHAQGSDTGTANVDLSVGYFLTDQVELGVIQGLSYNFNDGGEDTWSAATVGFANYNFASPEAKFVPFAGAFGGVLWNDDDATGTIGPNLGVKYFLGDETFLVTRYRYEWAVDSLELNEVDDNQTDGNHVVTVGLGMKF